MKKLSNNFFFFCLLVVCPMAFGESLSLGEYLSKKGAKNFVVVYPVKESVEPVELSEPKEIFTLPVFVNFKKDEKIDDVLAKLIDSKLVTVERKGKSKIRRLIVDKDLSIRIFILEH